MKNKIPYIIKYGDDSLVIKGSAEQIQEGKPVEAMDLDGEIVTVVPGDFIEKLDDGTVAHRIVPPIRKPEIIGHPSEKYISIVVGSAEQIKEGESIEAVTLDGKKVSVVPGDFIWKLDDDRVAHHIKYPIQKPVIRPLQNDILIIVGSATQLREGESIEAITPDGETTTVVPGTRLLRSDDGLVSHLFISLDQRENFMDELTIVSENYARTHNAYVIYYSGEINHSGFKELTNMVQREKKSTDRADEQSILLLILFTPGGDPHVAYRCANLLRSQYGKFQILIPGICKSAGTLMAIGAHEIYISNYGELGPIDMQVLEKNEGKLGSSGIIRASLNAIRENSYDTFHFYMDKFNGYYGTIKLSTRLNIANDMAGRIDRAIAERIDPIELGKMHRFLQTCYQYGIRLAERGGNVDADGVAKLVYDYPEHSFVIDNSEARTIFKRQISLSPDLYDIIITIQPYTDELNSESCYAKPHVQLIAKPHSD